MNQHQQRAAQRKGWGSPIHGRRVNAAPSIIDLDHDQDWSASCRAGLELSRQDVGFRGSDRTGGIAMLPVHLTRTAGGWCINAQRRRLVASPPGRPAAALQFVPAVMASGSQLRFSDHVPAKFADRSEAYHLERPSSLASDDQKHSERHIPHVRESVGEVRNDD
jgi:hypothetical protein